MEKENKAAAPKRKADYYINKKRGIIDFLFGLFGGALFLGLVEYAIFFVGSKIDLSGIGYPVFIFLMLVVPIAMVLVAFGKISSKYERKYLAIGVLVLIGLAFSVFIGLIAGFFWGAAFVMIFAASSFLRPRSSTAERENIFIMFLGLASGGLVWKLAEIARNGAIYPILMTEWLTALIAGLVTRRRIIMFAIVISTAVLLWYTMLTNICTFDRMLHW